MMFIFLLIFLHVVRDSLNVAQWTITSTIHDAVYTERRRELARELIASQVMNRNHEKIDQDKKLREKMKETRKRQKERKIEREQLENACWHSQDATYVRRSSVNVWLKHSEKAAQGLHFSHLGKREGKRGKRFRRREARLYRIGDGRVPRTQIWVQENWAIFSPSNQGIRICLVCASLKDAFVPSHLFLAKDLLCS